MKGSEMNELVEFKERFAGIVQSTEKFSVDFDQAWQWVGYSTKQKAREALERYFEEDQDFLTAKLKSTGGRPQDGYFLTVECFKSFCMMAGTQKGKEVRKYYIKIEKAWNTPELVMARALQAFQKPLETYQQEIAELRIQIAGLKTWIAEISQRQNTQGSVEKLPELGSGEQKTAADIHKVKASNHGVNSSGALDMRVVAAEINKPGWGRNNIFALLRKEKIVDDKNVPYEPYLEKGYFKVFEYKWVDFKNEIHTNVKTLVYPGKGVEFIRKLIER
jgi:anti-repressor protein